MHSQFAKDPRGPSYSPGMARTIGKVGSLAALVALVRFAGLACGGGSPEVLTVGDAPEGGAGFQENDDGGAAAAGTLAVSIAPPSMDLCAGQCVTLSAKATGGRAPYSYRWDHGLTSNDGSVNVCPTATTTYTATATDSSGNAAGEVQAANAMGSAKTMVTVSNDCSDGGASVLSGDCDSVAASFIGSGVNPVPPWSYGWTPSLGGAFTLFPTFYPQMIDAGAYSGIGWPNVAQWFDHNLVPTSNTDYSSAPVPDVMFNPSAATVSPTAGNFSGDSFTMAPGQFGMWPGGKGEYGMARWTAPATGTFGITATFGGLTGDNGFPQKTTTDVHVQHNGADLASGSGYLNLNQGGNTFVYRANVHVAAGDTIDFAVGNGGNLDIYDATSLDALVCKGTGDAGP